MKIILVQNEIEEAIRSYMANTLSVPADKDLQIEMTATRGASGVTAEINVISKERVSMEIEPDEVQPEMTKDPVTESLTEDPHNPFAEPTEEVKPIKAKSLFADLQASN